MSVGNSFGVLADLGNEEIVQTHCKLVVEQERLKLVRVLGDESIARVKARVAGLITSTSNTLASSSIGPGVNATKKKGITVGKKTSSGIQ